MHELPDGLANSLRSWRGSIYGNDGARSPRRTPSHNLEMGKAEDYGDKEFERALSSTSVILHPTASRQALNEIAQMELQQQEVDQQVAVQDQLLRPQEQYPAPTVQHFHPPQPVRDDDQIRSIPQNKAAQPKVVTNVATRQATIQDPPDTAHPSIFDYPPVADPDNAAARLAEDLTPLKPDDFYELMGMRIPTSKQQNPRELAIKRGLYERIRTEFYRVQGNFRLFDGMTYVLLLLQLLLSAVFIVLGSVNNPGNKTNVTITALGAVSTVVAGTLALMKGQGLPNRLRQTRDGLKNVLFEAEELYWDVGAEKPVLYKDIKKVRTDFLRVMEEERKNHPDTWNSIASNIGGGIKPPLKAQSESVPYTTLQKP